MAAIDFDGDGKPELFGQNVNSGQVYLYKLNGNQWISGQYLNQTVNGSSQQLIIPSGWKIRAMGDMNYDSIPDLIVQNTTTYETKIYYLNSAGTVNNIAAITPQINAGWRICGVGDFNRDGQLDLIGQNETTNQVFFYYQDKTYSNLTYSGAYLNPTPNQAWRIMGYKW